MKNYSNSKRSNEMKRKEFHNDMIKKKVISVVVVIRKHTDMQANERKGEH
jgi:hypothetical protein